MATGTESKAVTKNDSNDELSGFLKKKGRFSSKWTLVFAKVESCFLRYGPSEESQLKSVNLVGSVIEDWDEKGAPNIFSIQVKEAKRKYIFSADNSEIQKNWLQAVCLAKLSKQSSSDKSEACIIQ